MRSLRALPLLLACLSWSACANGDLDGVGSVRFVLTDAAVDELVQFEVDVGNVVLTHLDGTLVGVMPRRARVDFTDLTSVGELVTASELPSGTYTALAMDLDFATARVAVLGQSGPATVVDTAGVPITGTVTVSVAFAPRSRPVIGRGRRHLFQLDLELDQAVTVDVGANEVKFAPVLSAVVDPDDERPIVTTGILTAVDLASSTLTVERRAVDGNALAQFTVRTANLTVFQRDGVVELGAAGLAALPPYVGQRIYAQGLLAANEARFDAFAVEIGTGVPGNGQDWVLGHVTGRDLGRGHDATLTVVGRSFDVGTSTRRYNQSHTIAVSLANTKVLRRGFGNAIDSDAINVGQLVFAFGDLTGTALDASAATGVVRLLPTRVFGVAAGAASGGRVTLDVVRFDLRAESAFDFTVGGQLEADRDAFAVDVGSLATSGIVAGSKLEVRAFLSPVGFPSFADAEALAITDRTAAARALLLQWSTPSTSAVAGTTAASITVDLAGAAIAVVGDGFAPVAVTSSPPPILEPLGALGIYRLVLGDEVGVHFTFDGFRRALLPLLGTHGVFRVAAVGTYDAASQTFSASRATVVLR